MDAYLVLHFFGCVCHVSSLFCDFTGSVEGVCGVFFAG
jgi:hypothetical protein